uniref:Uncharacterized protein n=1 Tax=Chenopodium quinoa TaxID=63459 RepID=A0A803N9K5_CHEQI
MRRKMLSVDGGMKPQHVPLDKLTPKSKKYKIKVKVKEKSPAKYPENKKAFQILDNKIRGTLFDDEIKNFQNILEHEKEYIIADAPVRNTNPMYRHKEGDYYLSFGGSAAIQSLNPNTGPVLPNYIPIAEVPPTNILGVVVYLEETKKKKVAGGYEFDVRDVIVVDDSVQKVGDGLVISLYGELATKDCAQLSAWILENQDRVSDHMGHHLSIGEESSSDVIMSVKDLNKKHTTAYERHWIHVTIPDAKQEDCSMHCRKEVSVSFTAMDDTGSIRLTAYGKQCEALFGLKDAELVQKKARVDVAPAAPDQHLVQERLLAATPA